MSGNAVDLSRTAIAAPERQGFAEAVRKYRVEIKDQLSPAEQGEAFIVPRLVTEIQGTFEFADTDVFMEFHDWQLADHPAQLDEGAFAIRETARNFEIDIDGNRVTYQFADEAEQLALDVDVEGWTPQNLVLWLDRQLRQPDIHQSDMLKWLTDCIGHLVGPRKLSIAALMRTKFILARKLNERISEARAAERNKVYQRYLFAPEAKVDVSFDNGFAFRDGMYSDQKRHRYAGRFRFAKHFLGADAVPAFDGIEAGEEFHCAQALDSLPQVKFWIRNVARDPQSFWLPTASDKFYPDFVAQLNDGRFFVVEYKGALLAGAGVDDTNEKRAIGRLWESRSGGKGLFLVVEKDINGRDMRSQMLEKLGV
jgi:type III restriction enzyme